MSDQITEVRASKDIAADIGRLEELLETQHQRLEGLAANANFDYRALLKTGSPDTATVQGIADVNAHITVLEGALRVARIDLAAAVDSEVAQMRHEAQTKTRSEIQECREVAERISGHLEQCGALLTELDSRQRTLAQSMREQARTLGPARQGLLLMESVSSLTDPNSMQLEALLGLRKLAPFIRVDHVPAGRTSSFADSRDKVFNQAIRDFDDALGLI